MFPLHASLRPAVNSDCQHGVSDQQCAQINVELDGDAGDGDDLIDADGDNSDSECSLDEKLTRDKRPTRWLADFYVG